jgi:hypothetical protein
VSFSPSDRAQSLLSSQSEAVVKATAAVVADNAERITACFYPAMFAAHPELLRVFNQGNQATGEQSRALAASVVAYAVQLVDPDAPPFHHVMQRIAHSTSPSGSAQSSTRSSGTTCWARSGKCSATLSPPRSPKPGTRSTGCLPPS